MVFGELLGIGIERQQFVKIGDTESKCMSIVCGLPQGSILAPLLFNLYINDIFKVSDWLKKIYYLLTILTYFILSITIIVL